MYAPNLCEPNGALHVQRPMIPAGNNGTMSRFVWCSAFISIFLFLPAKSETDSMNTYLWQNRPLVILVPDAQDDLLVSQREALAGRAADLKDRDMVIIEVIGNKLTVDGATAPKLTAEHLRRRLNAQAHLTETILIGKDGGVKLRRPAPISAGTLFQTIDAMPMRRQEMGRGE